MITIPSFLKMREKKGENKFISGFSSFRGFQSSPRIFWNFFSFLSLTSPNLGGKGKREKKERGKKNLFWEACENVRHSQRALTRPSARAIGFTHQ
jgi:hypothetical protein